MGEHADQPPPRLPFFLAQGAAHVREHEQLVRQAALAEGAAADLPPPAPAGELEVDHTGRVAP